MNEPSTEPAGKDDTPEIDPKGHEDWTRSDDVPPIGTRWRWYDIPYRAFDGLLRGWPRRFMHWRIQRILLRGINFFNIFNYYDRAKLVSPDDRSGKSIVFVDENVRQGGLWVIDLFPPSRIYQLEKKLRRNGWDRNIRATLDGTNTNQLKLARTGQGFTWSRIGTIVRPRSNRFIRDAVTDNFPKEFEYIELDAVQIGTSVTAVVAFIPLSEFGQNRLNSKWHAEHEPTLKLNGLQRPEMTDRYFAGIKATQSERQEIHNLARWWLSRHCDGFFSACEAGQPVLDLNLFDEYNPLTHSISSHYYRSLRTLGLEGSFIEIFTSDQLPGVSLVPPANSPGRGLLGNCWGIVGNHNATTKANEKVTFNNDPYSAIGLAEIFDEPARAFILRVGVIRYLEEMKARYAISRDQARSRHGKFSARRVSKLRNELLTHSFDLPAVARDTAKLWNEDWKSMLGIDVRGISAPGVPSEKKVEFDLMAHLGKRRDEGFKQLLEDDEVYRTVLSTVASLGSSANATRSGRVAIAVAAASLVVAFATLMIAPINGQSAMSEILSWLR